MLLKYFRLSKQKYRHSDSDSQHNHTHNASSYFNDRRIQHATRDIKNRNTTLEYIQWNDVDDKKNKKYEWKNIDTQSPNFLSYKSIDNDKKY